MPQQFINPRTLKQDITAGLVLGVESVPDGLAQGVLAMVNPIYGLYGYMVGTLSGAFFTSSVFMAVQATGAMSLIVASVPQVHDGENAPASLFALAIMTGLVMLAAGLLKLGSMLRFVPNAVMTGFLNAVAILIILGQLDDFTGFDSSGPNKVAKALDLSRNLDQLLLPTLMVGILTILLILALEKTRLGALGMVAAIIVTSMMVSLAGWQEVALVSSIADIPGSLPRPVLPPLGVIPPLVLPAFALAFVGLVQGAGVSKNYANPDGNYPDTSGDFVGQGAANIFAGLFQGMPVGGSVSATSLSTNAGARSRSANIFAGLTMAAIILLFGGLVGYIALPAIAGLLIVIGFRTIKPDQVVMVWKTGRMQQVVMVITFTFSLLIPLQHAVMVGVGLAVLLFMFQQSNQITVKQWVDDGGRTPLETDPPETVAANQVTALAVYGSVFFATASLVEERLPEVTEDTRRAVVILSLRGGVGLGSTFLEVLDRYGTSLREHHSRLILASVTEEVDSQLKETGIGRTIGRDNIFMQTERLGEAFGQAWDAAEKWLAEQPLEAVSEDAGVEESAEASSVNGNTEE